MGTIAKRVAAVLLAVIGVVIGVGGVWFVSQLGSTGTATFTVSPKGTTALVLSPSILNRVDTPVKVSARATSGGTVWIGAARPSDALSALGEGRHREVTGLEVSGWALTTKPRGSADLPQFGRADVWHAQESGKGTQSLTIAPKDAPETVVVTAEQGTIATVTLTFTNKAWFVQSVIAALVGLFLILAGVLLWRLRIGAARAGQSPSAPLAPVAESSEAESSEAESSVAESSDLPGPDAPAAQEVDR